MLSITLYFIWCIFVVAHLLIMKKLTLFLIALINFINVSYASFPITDTLQTEEVKQYHQSLLKMGIDLSSCRCESCRKGHPALVLNAKGELVKVENKISHGNVSAMYVLAGLILLGVIVWLLIGVISAYNCLNDRADCPQSSGEKPKSRAPSGLLWASLLVVISIVIAIKARITQLKYKKIRLKNTLKKSKN